MTLADEDTKSIQTDNANRAIQGNEAMHVTQPKGRVITNARGAIRRPTLQSIQLLPSGGIICN